MRKIIFPALIISLLAVAAQAQVWNWSKTSTSNGSIDASVNWQEGMAPVAVNASARSTMARIAEYRDDTAGMIVDVGSASAYSVSSNSGSTNPPKDGQQVCFVPSNTNAANATLSVDFGTAYPIQSPVTTAITASVMNAGTPYCLIFNNAHSAWLLHSAFGNPSAVPLGVIFDYIGSTPPNTNFVFPFGQAISRTTYAAYFALVSTTYGVGDGSTTFNVPDVRGRLLVAMDNMGGSGANRVNTAGSGVDGTTLGASGGAQNYTMAQSDMPNTTLAIPAGQGSHSHAISPAAAQINGNYDPAANSSGAVNGASATQAATLPSMATAAINGGVTQTPIQHMSPAIMLNKILRVL